jgi:hypothetical protein
VAHSIGGRDGVTEVWAHGTVLQPEPSSASEARDFVCLQLIEHKLLHLVEDIRLVASEFATIAMVYTRAPFTLRLERMNDLIRLTVVEGSPPLPVRASANIIDSSRQSMSVVEVVSQSWGMDPNPTGTRTLWACFTVRSRFL